MRLELAIHPITRMESGAATRLEGTVLEVDLEELRGAILEDKRLERVDLEIVRPGENCRVGVIFDILEPRTKEPGSGPNFPGILERPATAGNGMTHVLRGAAVTVVDIAALVGDLPIGSTINKVLELSGPAADATPYGVLQHLVVVPHPAPDVAEHSALNALRLASTKTAVYLAKAAFGHQPASTEVFDLDERDKAPDTGAPRIAYIAQVHSHQYVAEPDHQIVYGSNTAGMLPTVLHPNEWLDGAVVCSYFNMQIESHFYQNHPVIEELYRRHRLGELTFVGTIATAAASSADDRDRSVAMAAGIAKEIFGADGVVLTKHGGGAAHADLSETARRCEELAMRGARDADRDSGHRHGA
jgi:glycine reductase